MWLCLQQRMLTADRLIRWRIEVTQTCVLCHQDPESHEHLFVHCPVAKALWTRVLMWINRLIFNATNWDDFPVWSINHAKGRAQPAQLFKMVFVECIYSLWIERNQLLFEKRSKIVDLMANDVAYICLVRASPGLQTLVHRLQF